jgi:pilus assembly protein CpaB
MSPVRIIILLVAAAAAAAAVFLVRSMQMSSAEATGAPVSVQAPLVKQVLVAKVEIPLGRFVTPEDLRWLDWPDAGETKSFFEHASAPDALEKMVGAVAVSKLNAGEPITADKLRHPGQGGFMSAMVTKGMRAVSVEITAESAASGFIQPNDHVDVIFTRKRDDEEGNGMIGKTESYSILQNIRVLAIDSTFTTKQEGEAVAIPGSRATLELTPRDADLVYAAQEAGTLQLGLRSIADLEEPDGRTRVGESYLRGPSQREPIRVYRNGKATEALVQAR